MTTEPAAFHTSGIVRLTRPQLVGTLTGLLLAALLAAIDQTIVGTAEPRIIAQLSGFDRYPWIATAYLLSSTVSVPIFASLSDIHGRKPFFLLGATLFVVTSALCGAAGTLTFLPIDGMGQLILFRGLQGVGAGMVTGLLFTIVGDIFSPAERGRYQGLFAAVWGVAAIFGPTLGGWLTDHWSWRACFWVNLPVGAVAVAAIYFEFPHLKPRGAARRLDWTGFATLIGTVVTLLLALTWATQYGWTSLRVELLLAASALFLAAFLFVESRAAEPVIPLGLFRDPIISVCSICSFVLGIGMFGVIIYLPLFMQGVLGVSATQSGNLLTPLMMGAVVGSIVGGQTVSRSGRYKGLALVGSTLVAVGMIVFARLSAASPGLHVVYGMVIAGLGMGLLQPVYTLAVQNVAPRHQMGRSHLLDHLLPIDWQYRGRCRVRIDHADALSLALRAGDAAARPAGSAALFLEPVDAHPGAAAAGDGILACARRAHAPADAVCQRPAIARERPAPDLRLQRAHHADRRAAARHPSQRTAADQAARSG
jgi:EmrB/QacA subfamily drug resistance transporter